MMDVTVVKGGAGADYLLSTVANADKPRIGGMSDYYTLTGTPPGRFLNTRGGRAVNVPAGLVADRVRSDRLYKRFQHPVTGSDLTGSTIPDITSDGKSLFTMPDATVGPNQVVLVDLTFTLPKGVSVLWAMAGPDVQERILRAHHQTIDDVMAWCETSGVFATRSGHGGLVRAPVEGVIAARWDHWDSRTGDPHLHSHVAVSSRVRRTHDGKWMSLDTRRVLKAAVMVSEMHTNMVLDRLCQELGLQFALKTPISRKTLLEIRNPDLSVKPRAAASVFGDQTEQADASGAVVADVAGMPSVLTDQFSTRLFQVHQKLAQLHAAWQAEHPGVNPTRKQVGAWKDQAWLETRPAKPAVSVNPQSVVKLPTLGGLCAKWREQARSIGVDPDQLVTQTVDQQESLLNSPTSRSDELTGQLADLVLTELPGSISQQTGLAVQARRATWTMFNVRAAAERVCRLVRLGSVTERQQLGKLVTDQALNQMINLEPDRYTLPEQYKDNQLLADVNQVCVFNDPDTAKHTSHEVWDAETLLGSLITTTSQTIPALPADKAANLVQDIDEQAKQQGSHGLADDQKTAASRILSDKHRVVCLIGPAGSGKTTTLTTVREAWMTQPASMVIGLATSAAAAKVLAGELKIQTHTIAKWLEETSPQQVSHRENRIRAHQQQLSSPELLTVKQRRQLKAELARLLAEKHAFTPQPGCLMIVDEASMTGTLSLARLAEQTSRADGKLLLVGDPCQLNAIEAGGILGWVDRAGLAHQLTSLWRFSDPAEAVDSLALRQGYKHAAQRYIEAGRVSSGQSETMTDQAYQAAFDQRIANQSTILIAATNQHVTELNQRFSLELRALGKVDSSRSLDLHCGVDAALGETVISRLTDRNLTDQSGEFIRNGTLLTITNIADDQTVTAIRQDNQQPIILDGLWAKTNLELGYAVTAHRAQGITVDACHVLIQATEKLPRELLYVALTRGRQTNHLYLGLLTVEEAQTQHMRADQIPTEHGRLQSLIAAESAERTAHETYAAYQAEAYSLRQLVGEYAFLASHATRLTFLDELNQAKPGLADQLVGEGAFEALHATWGRLQTLPKTRRLQRLAKPVDNLPPEDVRDLAALLQSRLEPHIPKPGHPDRANWLAGHQPPIENAEPALQTIADQCAQHIHNRIEYLKSQLNQPVQPASLPGMQQTGRPAWISDLTPPANPTNSWLQALETTAIYRDIYQVTTRDALGPKPETPAQKAHWQHARNLLNQHHWTPQPPDHMTEDNTYLNQQDNQLNPSTTPWNSWTTPPTIPHTIQQP